MDHARVWYNDRLVDDIEAAASPMAPGLHYGLGVFEGIRAYPTDQGPCIFRLDAHMERMRKGAEALGLDFDPARCARGCRAILADSGIQDAYVRPLAFFGFGDLTLDVNQSTTNLMVACLPWGSHFGAGIQRGIRAHRVTMRRNAAAAIPPLKFTGGYVNSVLAKREASKAGFEEAIFQDEQGYVVEATGENVLLVKHGRLIAVEHPDSLTGITRSSLVEMTGAETRPVKMEELMDADEVFLAGTSAEVAPVAALDDRTWEVGPVTRELISMYDALVHGRIPERRSWLQGTGDPETHPVEWPTTCIC